MPQSLLRLFCVILAVTFAAGTAEAELRVSLKPDAITAASTSAVVFEASSLRLDITVARPDIDRSEGDSEKAIDRILGESSLYEESSARRTLATHFTIGMGDLAKPSLTAGKTTTGWEQDANLFEIVDGITKQGWRGASKGGPPLGPPPDMVFVIELDLPTALLVERALEKASSQVITANKPISIIEFHQLGRDWMQAALTASRAEEQQVSSDGGFDIQPVELQAQTVLGWLYQAALDLTLRGNVAASAKVMRGCEALQPNLITKLVPDQGAEQSTNPIEVFFQDMIGPEVSGFRTLVWVASAARDGTAAGWIAEHASRSGIFLAPDALIRLGTGVVMGPIAGWSDYRTALANGRIDPIVSDVYHCAGLLRARGETMLSASIFERSLGYRAARDALIARAGVGQPYPRFFTAAETVTKLLGIGMIDPLELHEADQFKALFDTIDDAFVNEACAGITGAESLIIGPRARKILRTINWELYHNVNLPVITELLAEGPYDDPFAIRDPVTGRTITRDLHPMFAAMRGTPLPFDLRMVLTEQGYIRERLPELIDLDSEEGRALDAQLTRTQQTLYCLQTAFVLRSTEDQDHRLYLANTRTYLEKAVAAGLFKADEQVFGNYWWRVATGTAMVMIAHERSADEFLDYMRSLMALQSRQVPEAAAAILKPGELERVDAVMRRGHDMLSPAEVQQVRRAASILLSATFGEDAFWGCSAMPMQSVIHGAMNAQGRALTVTASGGMSLVLALELGAGGALDADATPDTSNLGVCAAIGSRRDRLTSWATAGADVGLSAYWEENKHIVVFEKSQSLRSLIGPLAPFLRLQQTAGAPLVQQADWVLDRIADARKRQVDMERRLTLLQLLQKNGTSDDNLAALGIPASEFRALAAKVAAARPDVPDSLAKGGDRNTYSMAYDSEGTDKFLRDVEAPLADLFRFLEEAWAAEKDGPNPVRLPDGRFSRNDFFLTPDTGTPQLGIWPGKVLLGGLGLGGQVGLVLDKAQGEYFAGTLSVRLPGQRSPAAAGASGACDVVTTAYSPSGEPEPGATPCVPAKLIGDPGIVNASDVASLGVRFTRLGVPTDCAAADPAECWLVLEEIEDVDTIRPNQEALTDTLLRLGMPNFVSFKLFKVELGADRTLRDIILVGDLSVANVPLTPSQDKVRLTLRKDGEWREVLPALIAAAEARIDDEMAQRLARVEAFMEGLRLPANPESYKSALVRFGPVLKAGGTPDISIALDWERPSLGFRALYELSARLPDEPIEAAAIVRAGVELSLGTTGLKMQRIVFETPGMEAVNKRIAKLFANITDELDGYVDIAPEVRGGDLYLRLAFRKVVEGCPLEAVISRPFDEVFSATTERALKVAAKDILAQAAACLAEPLTAVIDTALQSQMLEVLGVPFVVTAGDGALQQAMDAQLPLVFTLAEGAIGPGAPLGACDGLAARGVQGIRLRADAGLKLDFRGMSETDQMTLGQMLACRIEMVTPDALKPYFELRGMAVGHDLIAADIALKDLPLLGTVVLPRQNFLNLDRDLGDILIEALGATASQALRDQIESHAIGLDVPGIGTVALTKGTLAFNLFNAAPNITAGINIEAYGITVPGRLEIGLDRGLDALRIQIDEDAAMTAAIEGVVARLLEFVPGDTVKIENPRFGRLDDLGREWGLVFGVKAEIPIEPGLIVGASRVVISESGVKLGEKITGGVSTPIYLGIVALSKTLINLYTGENGGKSGIEIGAELTAFEPQLAHLVKLRALLDLSEIAKPKFTLTGDLVVLSALEIFKSKGVLDLSQVRATFDAETTDAIRDILDFMVTLDLDGGQKRFLAKSQIGVLGIDMSRTDVAFCVKACGDGTGREHMAEVTVEERLPIGKGVMHAITDLDFRDPQVGAGIKLNLFGWEPGGARFDADLRRVQVALKFLGIQVKAVTPSIETMTPQYLIDLLKSLLDISLEDLLNIDPKDINISVMSGDGSTQSVHEGDADTEGSAQADDGQEDPADSSGTGVVSVESKETGAPPPQGDGRSASEQTPWGRAVFANICEKVVGTPKSKTIADDLDARFFIYSVSEKAAIVDAFRWTIELPENIWPWWRLYTKGSASELCSLAGKTYLLRNSVVGTDRHYVSWRHCDSLQMQPYSFTSIADVVPDQAREAPLDGAINLSTHLACTEVDGWSLAIWGEWFYQSEAEGAAAHYRIAPRCPSGEVLAKAIKALPEIARLCQDSGLLKIPAGPEGGGYSVPDLITADRVYQLTVTGLRPLIEGHGDTRSLVRDTSFSLPDVTGRDGRVYVVEPWVEQNGTGQILNWHMLMRHTGAEGQVEVVPLVLAAADPMIKYTARPAILAKALGLWLTSGKRPEILSSSDERYLVLGVSAAVAETNDAATERHLWLWQTAADSALIDRMIDFPLKLPAPGGTLGLLPGATPAKATILNSLWEEVRRLPVSTAGWKVVAGMDARKGSQSWAFFDLDAGGAPEQLIHILLDRVTSKNLAVDVLWDAALILPESPEETAELRAGRRRCITRRDIAEALGKVQDPKEDATEMLNGGAVDLALSDPSAFDRAYPGLRALPDPMVRLPDDTCPEAFE